MLLCHNPQGQSCRLEFSADKAGLIEGEDVLEALAASVISVLAPYIVKGGEAFAKEAGKAAFQTVGSLFQLIRSTFSGDPEAASTLEAFEQKPTRYESALKEILMEKLESDPQFSGKIGELLREMGPQLDVIQKMQVGKNITGMEIGEMASGKAKVDQTIDHGENVTGLKVNKVGGR